MSSMYKKLTYSVLSLFIVLFSTNATGQEIYYNDTDGHLIEVKNDLIKTESELVTLSWQPTKAFASPYIVTVWDADVCKDSIETNVASYVVNAKGIKKGHVGIRSINSGIRTAVKIEYNGAPFSALALLTTIALAFLSVALIYLLAKERKRRKAAEKEKDEISSPTRKTQKFDSVTVLFSDIQGFTKIAEHMNPEQLVDELDRYFIYFDELVDRYDVEKIKTIGDAYMCAGGVPSTDSANPIEVALVGLGMIAYVKERQAAAGGFWNIRVGLNTGPVISGALGHTKKIFDIWGDSVNTASRMESSGVPGEVNVSGDTYNKIADYFECEYRGKMPVKYKGEIDMYFVKRLKAEYAEVGSGHLPNKLLLSKIRMMKVEDMLNDFEKSLDEITGEKIFAERFERLRINCELICRKEQMGDRGLMMTKIALMYAYANSNCPKSARIEPAVLQKRLRKMRFEETDLEEIAKINNRIAQNKKADSHIEEVVYDSFSMIYNSKDIVKQIKDLYNCAAISEKHFSKKEWIKNQQHIIDNLSLYTNSARELAEVQAPKQKEILEQIFKQF